MKKKVKLTKKLTLPEIIGHRGVKFAETENTEAGIRLAAELGLKWIEIDVCLSLDNHPVIFHDQSLINLCGIEGDIHSHTWAELQKLLIQHPNVPSQPFIDLPLALTLCTELNLGLNLELKLHNKMQKQAYIDVILPIVSKYKQPLLISSFDAQLLKAFKDTAPIGMLYNHLPVNWLQQCQQLDVYSIHLNQLFITESIAQNVKQQGFQLLAFTQNDPEHFKKLKRWGVDSQFSDDPRLLIKR